MSRRPPGDMANKSPAPTSTPTPTSPAFHHSARLSAPSQSGLAHSPRIPSTLSSRHTHLAAPGSTGSATSSTTPSAVPTALPTPSRASHFSTTSVQSPSVPQHPPPAPAPTPSSTEPPYPSLPPDRSSSLLPPPTFKPIVTFLHDDVTGKFFRPAVYYLFSDDDPELSVAASLRSAGVEHLFPAPAHPSAADDDDESNDNTSSAGGNDISTGSDGPDSRPAGHASADDDGKSPHQRPVSPPTALLPPPRPGTKEIYFLVDLGADGKSVVQARSLSADWAVTSTTVGPAPILAGDPNGSGGGGGTGANTDISAGAGAEAESNDHTDGPWISEHMLTIHGTAAGSLANAVTFSNTPGSGSGAGVGGATAGVVHGISAPAVLPSASRILDMATRTTTATAMTGSQDPRAGAPGAPPGLGANGGKKGHDGGARDRDKERTGDDHVAVVSAILGKMKVQLKVLETVAEANPMSLSPEQVQARADPERPSQGGWDGSAGGRLV